MKHYLAVVLLFAFSISSLAVTKPNLAHLSKPIPDYECSTIYWTGPTTSQGPWIRNTTGNTDVYGWNTNNAICATWRDNSFSISGTTFLGERAFAPACQNANSPMNCPTQFQSAYAVNTQIGFADWLTEIKLKGTEATYIGYDSNCAHFCGTGIELTVQVEKECSEF